MGLSMFVGEGWECNDDTVKNKAECLGTYYVDNGTSILREDRLWERYELGYDNILDSIQTSLVITNQEGWPDIMYRYIDSAGIDQQPIRDNRPGASVFYILSVLIGNWIFLAVVTGITFDNMKRNQDILKGLHHLTDGQRKLLDYITLLISHKPKPPPGVKERSKPQQKLYNFFKSNTYEYIAFTVVSINIIIMALARTDSSKIEQRIQEISEYIFTTIYIIEVVLLMYSYKVKYFFYDYWNILNLVITVFAIFSITFEFFSQPNFLIVLRLIRIIRLVKFAKGLKALASAIIFNFYQLMNVTLLMFITCCIFAVIGMHSFGDIDYHKARALNEHVNFSTFPRSLLTVFIFSTGENWPVAMTDCSGRNLSGCDPNVENCGVFWAPVYFILLEVIFNWILLNSFSAITVDTFLNVLYDLDEINRIETITDNFRQVWLKYDRKGKGVVEFKDMLRIYREFRIPSNYIWGPRDSGQLLKPSIQKLFRTVVVYNNKCTYADALMSILNSWVGESLPDDIKLRYWRKRNWDRVYRSTRNTPMNNTLVMPSKEYSKNKKHRQRELERKQRRKELAKYSKSVPNLENTNGSSIFTKTKYSSRGDTNYHIRPTLRKSEVKSKTNSSNKYPKYKPFEMESDISNLPIKNLEEAMKEIPKYAVPLSSSSASIANRNSLVTTPTSNITLNSNNIMDISISSPKVIDKGKRVEPESNLNEINNSSSGHSRNPSMNTNIDNNNNNFVSPRKRAIFRIDSFPDGSIHQDNTSTVLSVDNKDNINNDYNNKAIKVEGQNTQSSNQKYAYRFDSSESSASSVPNLDITYEINKQISQIVKNKNNPIDDTDTVVSSPNLYEPPEYRRSTVVFEESSLHSNSGSTRRKPKRYSRVSSSLRSILKPYNKTDDVEDDANFDVTKDVIQFYVVYAIYRVQIKFKRSRKNKTKSDKKLEVLIKK